MLQHLGALKNHHRWYLVKEAPLREEEEVVQEGQEAQGVIQIHLEKESLKKALMTLRMV